MGKLMLYGANGYTGQLIAKHAADLGLDLILAGRSAPAIAKVAQETGLASRVFPLNGLADELGDIDALLLAAGPFVNTSAIAVEACLQTKTHYLDITGELPVFETLRKAGKRAKSKEIALLPGVGFDVVPSDCLAAHLHKRLPDATHLELAFSGGQLSRGTAKTMLTHLGQGSAIREDGKIRKIGTASLCKTIPFHDKNRACVAIPWGDVSTAHHSTQIPNIAVFTGMSPKVAKVMRSLERGASLMRISLLEKLAFAAIDRFVPGPDGEARQSRKVELYGRAWNSEGKVVEATLTTPEGYRLTAMCAARALERVSELEPGFQTPSRAFGADFIEVVGGGRIRRVQA